MSAEDMHEAPRCQHVRLSGRQCKAPAKRGQNYCLFHEAEHDTSPNLTFPPVEDAASVQVAADQVLQALRDNTIEFQRASLMFSGLRLMRANLKKLGLEMGEEDSPARTPRNTKDDDEPEGPSLAEILVERLELADDPQVQQAMTEGKTLADILLAGLGVEEQPTVDGPQHQSGHPVIGSSEQQTDPPQGTQWNAGESGEQEGDTA